MAKISLLDEKIAAEVAALKTAAAALTVDELNTQFTAIPETQRDLVTQRAYGEVFQYKLKEAVKTKIAKLQEMIEANGLKWVCEYERRDQDPLDPTKQVDVVRMYLCE